MGWGEVRRGVGSLSLPVALKMLLPLAHRVARRAGVEGRACAAQDCKHSGHAQQQGGAPCTWRVTRCMFGCSSRGTSRPQPHTSRRCCCTALAARGQRSRRAEESVWGMPGPWRLHCPTAVSLPSTAHDRQGGEASWPPPHLRPTHQHTTITATYKNNHPPAARPCRPAGACSALTWHTPFWQVLGSWQEQLEQESPRAHLACRGQAAAEGGQQADERMGTLQNLSTAPSTR